ncbi:MAG: hypothetical protein PHU14_05065 [Methylovulum sp.]|nr:hypothetical protein [Methylovulum sp.]
MKHITRIAVIAIVAVAAYFLFKTEKYTGDGTYSVKTEGFLWLKLKTILLRLPDIQLNKNSKYFYKIKGFCSSNVSFVISLDMRSSTPEHWWDNSTIVNVKLWDNNDNVLMAISGPLNGYNEKIKNARCPEITYQECPPDEGQWEARYIVKGQGEGLARFTSDDDGIPTNSFSEYSFAEKNLNCGEYNLSIEINQPKFSGDAWGHLQIHSGWKSPA